MIACRNSGNFMGLVTIRADRCLDMAGPDNVSIDSGTTMNTLSVSIENIFVAVLAGKAGHRLVNLHRFNPVGAVAIRAHWRGMITVSDQAGMYAALVLLIVFGVATAATLVERYGKFSPAADGIPGWMLFIGDRLVASGAADFAVHGVGIFSFCNMQRQLLSVLKRLFTVFGVAFQALDITFDTWLAGCACFGGRSEQ